MTSLIADARYRFQALATLCQQRANYSVTIKSCAPTCVHARMTSTGLLVCDVTSSELESDTQNTASSQIRTLAGQSRSNQNKLDLKPHLHGPKTTFTQFEELHAAYFSQADESLNSKRGIAKAKDSKIMSETNVYTSEQDVSRKTRHYKGAPVIEAADRFQKHLQYVPLSMETIQTNAGLRDLQAIRDLNLDLERLASLGQALLLCTSLCSLQLNQNSLSSLYGKSSSLWLLAAYKIYLQHLLKRELRMRCASKRWLLDCGRHLNAWETTW